MHFNGMDGGSSTGGSLSTVRDWRALGGEEEILDLQELRRGAPAARDGSAAGGVPEPRAA